MYEYTCLKCEKIFQSEDDLNALCARNEHYKWCTLSLFHKILKVILSPTALISFPLIFCGMILYFLLAPLAYPIFYSFNLVFENEVYSWKQFRQDAHLELEGAVYTSRKKKSK